MSTNQEVITRFYTAFQRKDYRGMQVCYADKAIFNDPVFRNLNAAQVRSMWEMFCVKGKDLIIEFSNVSASESSGQAEWTAYYTFSATGRNVVNHIKSHFLLEHGEIVAHTDTFSFYRWAAQALGPTGIVLGWTPFVRNKVRQTAQKNLENFMNNRRS